MVSSLLDHYRTTPTEDVLGWAVAAGIAYTAYKVVFGSRSGSENGRTVVDPAKVQLVQDALPHLSQRSIRWELARNGHSVERAVERALREGGLPEPPASYFPPGPNTPSTSDVSGTTTTTATRVNPNGETLTNVGGGGAAGSASSAKPPPPSLIKRLGLDDHVGAQESDTKGKGKQVQQGEGWSNSREEREERLRKRKEKLVLEARRKLLEKEQRRDTSQES
ncbi:CUE domain-containing protein [Sporobolomyces koalae]|uniref:CUE domain-containing protein n=1 Tax=Sporobolomyces koalae TaxID=500713 RepID=UPI0031769CDF